MSIFAMMSRVRWIMPVTRNQGASSAYPDFPPLVEMICDWQ
jgi:hypothetical protein